MTIEPERVIGIAFVLPVWPSIPKSLILLPFLGVDAVIITTPMEMPTKTLKHTVNILNPFLPKLSPIIFFTFDINDRLRLNHEIIRFLYEYDMLAWYESSVTS